MGKKSGRRRMSSDQYSLPQVAVMLLATSELWLGATRPRSMTWPDVESETMPSVVYADLVRRLRLTDAEGLINGLVDLEAAMGLVGDSTRAGIASFVTYGPQAVEEDRVLFQPFQARHVLTVWRAINRAGEFAKEDGNVRSTGSPAGDVSRLSKAAA